MIISWTHSIVLKSAYHWSSIYKSYNLFIMSWSQEFSHYFFIIAMQESVIIFEIFYQWDCLCSSTQWIQSVMSMSTAAESMIVSWLLIFMFTWNSCLRTLVIILSLICVSFQTTVWADHFFVLSLGKINTACIIIQLCTKLLYYLILL